MAPISATEKGQGTALGTAFGLFSTRSASSKLPIYSGKFRRFRFEAHKLEMTGPPGPHDRNSASAVWASCVLKHKVTAKHNNITFGCSARERQLPSYSGGGGLLTFFRFEAHSSRHTTFFEGEPG
jgi:hypothetical protein